MSLRTRRAAAKRPSLLLAALFGSAFAATGYAQDKCSATGVMAGEKFAANHCAATLLTDEHSVTLWFNESPITVQEAEAFRVSAYANTVKDGKERTMLLVAFCPGGGKAAASAGAIKAIDLNLTHAKSAMAGAQWVVNAPKDFKVESIAGDIRPGGKLTGRITGGRSSDGRPYAWDLSFSVTLPAKDAAAGLGCK